jgi:hypothetical protein
MSLLDGKITGKEFFSEIRFGFRSRSSTPLTAETEDPYEHAATSGYERKEKECPTRIPVAKAASRSSISKKKK